MVSQFSVPTLTLQTISPPLTAPFPNSSSLAVRWRRKLEAQKMITDWDKNSLLETPNEIRKQMVAVTLLITECVRKEANESHAHRVESDITPKQKGCEVGGGTNNHRVLVMTVLTTAKINPTRAGTRTTYEIKTTHTIRRIYGLLVKIFSFTSASLAFILNLHFHCALLCAIFHYGDWTW